MSVRYINKKGEEVEISPCFSRIKDLELPDLDYKSRLHCLLTNSIKIPPIIYNPILENFKISYELEKEKKARLILEERIKKLENVLVSHKFDAIGGITCHTPINKSSTTKPFVIIDALHPGEIPDEDE